MDKAAQPVLTLYARRRFRQFVKRHYALVHKMAADLKDPEYWRFRAKNTRALATETKDVSAKKILEDVAASYERLADLAEQGSKEKSAEES